MQNAPTEYINAIKRGYHIKGQPLCVAEWNYNWSVITTVVNQTEPTQKWPYNETYFPVDSIADGFRPTRSGIYFAFTNKSLTSNPNNRVLTEDRYYTCSEDQPYKYWISPTPSSEMNIGISDGGTDQYAINNVSPKITYNSVVKPNKIRVIFNTVCLPTDWSISVTGPSGTAIVATNPDIDPVTGVCEIWYDGSSWVGEQQLDEDNFVEVQSLEMTINKVDSSGERIHLIEFAAIKEVDLTPRLVSYSVDMSMDEENFVYPVGQISSNGGSITLSNHDLKISDDFRHGPYSGLLDSWVQVRLYVNYDLSDYGGAESYIAPVATMYSNDWTQSDQREYELQLFDVMKILQETDCQSLLVRNRSIARVLIQLLDTNGIDTYSLQYNDFDPTAKIRYYWTNGEDSLYECLKEICEAYQCAIYVDELGKIQLITKEQIANDTDTPVWTFLGQNDGQDIPDIISLKKKYQKSANQVSIKYKKMQVKTDVLDLERRPLTSKAWSSEDSVVLKSTALGQNITAAEGQDIILTPKQVESWPFKGKANIEGEVFEYDGKGYRVWDYANNSHSEKIALTPEDIHKYDLESYNSSNPPGLDPAGRLNGYTGKLKVTKRNVNKLGAREHLKNIREGWWMMNFYHTGNAPDGRFYDWGGAWPTSTPYDPAGFKNRYPWYPTQARWSISDSVLTCDNVGIDNYERLSVAMKQGLPNNQMRYFATRMKFDSPFGHGGLIINSTDVNGFNDEDFGPAYVADGKRCYIINLITTDSLDSKGIRAWRNEIFCEVRNGSGIGPVFLMGESVVNGARMQIDSERWYDIEVIFVDEILYNGKSWSGIQIYIDGSFVGTFLCEDRIHPTATAGLFARGDSKVSFEHFFSTETRTSDFASKADDKVSAFTVQLPAGNNKKETVTFPQSGTTQGNVVVSISSESDISVSKMLFTEDFAKRFNGIVGYDPVTGLPLTNPYVYPVRTADLGSFVAPGLSRMYKEVSASSVPKADSVTLTYSCDSPVSLCVETSRIQNFPYNGIYYNAPTNNSIYDIQKGGYLSTGYVSHIMGNAKVSRYLKDDLGDIFDRQIYFEDFGAFVQEIRDFEVDLDVSPCLGTRVYLDNENVRVLDFKYNPIKGIFTLVNISRRDQIVSGTEELGDSESIDRTLMIYGHILEEKEEKEEKVEDAAAIKKYGPMKMDLEAKWVFDDETAKSLANWVVKHWSEPMETLDIEVFSNTFSNIGDKVNVKYWDSGFAEQDLFIITKINRSFSEGFRSSLVLRRVK